MFQCCSAHSSASALYRPNYFVNKIFVMSRLITKFRKMWCNENLELYGIVHAQCGELAQVLCDFTWHTPTCMQVKAHTAREPGLGSEQGHSYFTWDRIWSTTTKLYIYVQESVALCLCCMWSYCPQWKMCVWKNDIYESVSRYTPSGVVSTPEKTSEDVAKRRRNSHWWWHMFLSQR